MNIRRIKTFETRYMLVGRGAKPPDPPGGVKKLGGQKNGGQKIWGQKIWGHLSFEILFLSLF